MTTLYHYSNTIMRHLLFVSYKYPSDNIGEADADEIKAQVGDGVPLGEDDAVIILYQDDQQH